MPRPYRTYTPDELTVWIRELISQDNIHAFYICKAWLHLRAEVLKEQHYECQLCKAKGLAVPATTVHHIKTVRKYPWLALTNMTYSFNTNGYLISIKDKDGNTEKIRVDNLDGNLVRSITDTNGQSNSVGYANGKISSIIDSQNRAVTYGYTDDNLTSVTDSMGNTATYTYTDGLLTKITDSSSNTQKVITYSSDHKVLTLTDSTGNISSYAYDADANTITVTGSNSTKTVYTYNDCNLLQSITKPDGSTTVYNQYGEKIS